MRASIGGRATLKLAVRPRTRRPEARLEIAAGGMAWLENGDRRRVLARNASNPFAAATALVLGDAMTRIARNEEPPTSARRALEIVCLVDAVYESAACGRSVMFSVR